MTGTLAKVCDRRPMTTTAIWGFLVMLAAVVSARFLDGALKTDAYESAGRLETEQAERLLEDQLQGSEPKTELVIVQSQPRGVTTRKMTRP